MAEGGLREKLAGSVRHGSEEPGGRGAGQHQGFLVSGEWPQQAAGCIGRRATSMESTGAEEESISWAPGSLILWSHNGQGVWGLKIKGVVPDLRVKEWVHFLVE